MVSERIVGDSYKAQNLAGSDGMDEGKRPLPISRDIVPLHAIALTKPGLATGNRSSPARNPPDLYRPP
jgi:hypothetical protein